MAYNPLAFGQMLVAMGSLVFAAYLYGIYKDTMDRKQEKGYGGVFILLGLIASAFGLGMFMNEPISGQYIEVYGVGYMVFTLVMLMAGLTLLFDWDVRPAGYLATIGGVALLSSAYAIWANGLSKDPAKTTALFLLSGLGALGSAWMVQGDHKRKKLWILVGVLIFALFGLAALYGGASAQFGHVQRAVQAAATA